jgi:hypothetical protein
MHTHTHTHMRAHTQISDPSSPLRSCASLRHVMHARLLDTSASGQSSSSYSGSQPCTPSQFEKTVIYGAPHMYTPSASPMYTSSNNNNTSSNSAYGAHSSNSAYGAPSSTSAYGAPDVAYAPVAAPSNRVPASDQTSPENEQSHGEKSYGAPVHMLPGDSARHSAPSTPSRSPSHPSRSSTQSSPPQQSRSPNQPSRSPNQPSRSTCVLPSADPGDPFSQFDVLFENLFVSDNNKGLNNTNTNGANSDADVYSDVDSCVSSSGASLDGLFANGQDMDAHRGDSDVHERATLRLFGTSFDQLFSSDGYANENFNGNINGRGSPSRSLGDAEGRCVYAEDVGSFGYSSSSAPCSSSEYICVRVIIIWVCIHV